jgi:hypothetical protein
MDKLLDTLKGYLSAATDLVKSYAPQAWDALLLVTKYQALFHALICLLLFLIFGTISGVLFRRAVNSEYYEETQICTGIGVAFLACTVICFVVGLSNAFDWWLAFFHPDVSILYSLYEKLIEPKH